jgi:hypothetical protein
MMTACSSSPPIRYYTLAATTPPASTQSAMTSLRRGPYAVEAVIIPDLLDRPQIVARTSTNSVEILDYDRWAAPLGDQLERALAADLSARLGPQAVVDPGLAADLRAVREISVSILAFEPSRRGESAIEASWVISDAKSGSKPNGVRSFRTRHVMVAKGSDVEDIVRTMSDLVAAIAEDIATSTGADD